MSQSARLLYKTSFGPEIFPVTALAAATYGLARYTSLVTSPIRPTKLRFVVETHLSCAARIPIDVYKRQGCCGADLDLCGMHLPYHTGNPEEKMELR